MLLYFWATAAAAQGCNHNAKDANGILRVEHQRYHLEIMTAVAFQEGISQRDFLARKYINIRMRFGESVVPVLIHHTHPPPFFGREELFQVLQHLPMRQLVTDRADHFQGGGSKLFGQLLFLVVSFPRKILSCGLLGEFLIYNVHQRSRVQSVYDVLDGCCDFICTCPPIIV